MYIYYGNSSVGVMFKLCVVFCVSILSLFLRLSNKILELY